MYIFEFIPKDCILFICLSLNLFRFLFIVSIYDTKFSQMVKGDSLFRSRLTCTKLLLLGYVGRKASIFIFFFFFQSHYSRLTVTFYLIVKCLLIPLKGEFRYAFRIFYGTCTGISTMYIPERLFSIHIDSSGNRFLLITIGIL